MTAEPPWATSLRSVTSRRSFPPTNPRASGSPDQRRLAVELVRLFQVELEHYEKIEGAQLSMEGKANRLATLLRGNLGSGDAGSGRRSAVGWIRHIGNIGAASSPTTSPAARTKSTSSTPSAPARSSLAVR